MIQKKAEAFLPTIHGNFKVIAFSDGSTSSEYAALVKGDVNGRDNVCARIHSGCITGDVFGSLMCDCHEQLMESMKQIQESGLGVLIYDRQQEGRGLGLVFKIKAYELQENGLDTVQAMHNLGFTEDLRTYKAATEILKILGVKSIELLTNNPDKISQVEKLGVKVAKRIPLLSPPNEHNKRYLEIKKEKMGHLY